MSYSLRYEIMFLSLFSMSVYANRRGLIVDGQETPPNQYPFTGLSGYYNPYSYEFFPVCGCTILSPRFVVTAAHCVDNEVYGWRRIVMTGIYSIDNFASEMSRLNNPARASLVKRAEIHQDYDLTRRLEFTFDGSTRTLNEFAHDIAILELIDPTDWMPVKHFQNAWVVSDSDSEENTATAVGWGFVGNDISQMSDRPNHIKLPLVSQSRCTQIYWDVYANVYVGDDTHLCAGGIPERGICNGDSGSSLLKKNDMGEWQLIGMPSFSLSPSPNCGAVYGEPTVFTRISSLSNWICKRTTSVEACRDVSFEEGPTNNVTYIAINLDQFETPKTVLLAEDKYVLTALPSRGLVFHKLPLYYPHGDWRSLLGDEVVELLLEGDGALFSIVHDSIEVPINVQLQGTYIEINTDVYYMDSQSSSLQSILSCPQSTTPMNLAQIEHKMQDLKNSSRVPVPWLLDVQKNLFTLPNTLKYALSADELVPGTMPGSLRVSNRRLTEDTPRIDSINRSHPTFAHASPETPTATDPDQVQAQLQQSTHGHANGVPISGVDRTMNLPGVNDRNQGVGDSTSNPSAQLLNSASQSSAPSVPFIGSINRNSSRLPFTQNSPHVSSGTGPQAQWRSTSNLNDWYNLIYSSNTDSIARLNIGTGLSKWAVVKFKPTNDLMSPIAIAIYIDSRGELSAPIIMGGRLIVNGYDVQQFCASSSITPDEIRYIIQ